MNLNVNMQISTLIVVRVLFIPVLFIRKLISKGYTDGLPPDPFGPVPAIQ